MATRVLLRIPAQAHSSLNVLISNPPDGFSYIREERPQMEQSNSFYRAVSRILPRYAWTRNALLLARERLGSFAKSSTFPLIFSLGPYAGFSSVPTILFSNEVNFVGGTGMALSRALLLRANIKKILVPTPTSAQPFSSILSEGEVAKLIGVLRLGTPIPLTFKKEKTGRVTLLFVSSANRGDASWGDASFYLRGGLDVLNSFRRLNAQYGDRVNLVICSSIPDCVKEDFVDVLRLGNVQALGIVPRIVLDSLYSKGDVLLYPGYRGTYTIAEAFSHCLPVVASDSWDLADYVTSGYNGLLVHRETGEDTHNVIPSWDPRAIASKPVDEGFIARFTESVSRLIEDESLRLRLGEGARKTVESGPFSIQFMKGQLGRYFHEALGS